MCYLPQCYGIFHVFVSLVLSEEFSLHSNKIFWIFTPKLAKIASATPNNDFWRENSIVFTLKNERFALNVARLFDLFSNTVVHFSKKRYYPKYLLEKHTVLKQTKKWHRNQGTSTQKWLPLLWKMFTKGWPWGKSVSLKSPSQPSFFTVIENLQICP